MDNSHRLESLEDESSSNEDTNSQMPKSQQSRTSRRQIVNPSVS